MKLLECSETFNVFKDKIAHCSRKKNHSGYHRDKNLKIGFVKFAQLNSTEKRWCPICKVWV